MDKLIFTTTLKEVLVEIDEKSYTLRELDGLGLTQWRVSRGGEVSVNERGKPVITNVNIDDPEISLLSLCLYGPENTLVPKTVIQKWPSSTLEKLYDAAQELSGLNVAAKKRLEEEAKNS